MKTAIETFVRAAREEHAKKGAHSPFYYSTALNQQPADSVKNNDRDEWRLFPVDEADPTQRREICVVKWGRLVFAYNGYQGDRHGVATRNSTHVGVHYTLSGERTYSVDNVELYASAADTFALGRDKSPVFQVAYKNNYQGLSTYIPIPATQRLPFSPEVAVRTKPGGAALHGKYLGPSRLWEVHLSYALHQAVHAAMAGSASEKGATPNLSGPLEEYLYLLYRNDLLAVAPSTEPERIYTPLPRVLITAERFVMQEAQRAPTVESVAAAVGVSARNLREQFVKHRGMSPLDYIREQRLLGVRAALLEARPGDTVSAIAAAWGYDNFGNFAATYKERFAERPSDTLGLATKR